MADTKKIFGVCPRVSTQEKMMDKHCFGDCGKIIIGWMVDAEMGLSLCPCKEEICPHEEKRLEYGTINTGEMIWVRKLKEE